MKRQRNSKSMSRMILSALLLVMIADIIVISCGLAASGVNRRLNANARDILAKQAENRKSYLENTMVDSWSNLGALASNINQTAQKLREEGKLDLDRLDNSSEACLPLLTKVCDNMISTMYNKQVSGIFVLFNTHDLKDEQGDFTRTGLYIRDLDPLSMPSRKNTDLLLERSPIQMAQTLGISTDTSWQPLFLCHTEDTIGFLTKPYFGALSSEGNQDPEDFGYWQTTPYTLDGDSRTAISYSIPLILEDGTIYGVLGVELLTDYLQTLLPYGELDDFNRGSYILGSVSGDGNTDTDFNFTATVQSGNSFSASDGQTLHFNGANGGYLTTINGDTYYVTMQPLDLYSRNGPFIDEQWYLAGLISTKDLYAFSNQVFVTISVALLAALLLSVISCFYISRKLSRPVIRLSSEVESHRGKVGIPSFSPTGIEEIDQFSNAITELSQEVLDTSTKFLRIMDMASIELGGYELRKSSNSIYVTDNFFSLLGLENEDLSNMTAEKFLFLLDKVDRTYKHTYNPNGHRVYEIPLSSGKLRYLRLEVTQEEDGQVGLAEDVTASTYERLRIEHERDFDTLTGLYSRRAFQRICAELFRQPAMLGTAALLMMDLDNLKGINDTYGHDWGDQYIRQAGQCLTDYTPKGTVCARVSGDEFFALFYGYDDRTQIREALENLIRAVRESVLHLPSGKLLNISASAGVAWYPDDSRDFLTLMKYADFAMYQIKRSQKGKMSDFDIGAYNQVSFRDQSRKEFLRMISEELVSYHFQPIFSVEDGAAVAYEALMRVDMPTLHSPDAVMKIAKEENRLHEIERITLFKSAGRFLELLEEQSVSEDALLFVNSIASEMLTEEEVNEFCRRFHGIQNRLVVEITEAESLNPVAMEAKRNTPGFSGMFALDDYGSGYNTEKNLIELSPKYIKVDMSIIRDIDSNPDKQQILSNIASYAHRRGMYIIAEGLETREEVITAIELGTDLLQGYFLARPAAIPAPISPEAETLLLELSAARQSKI